MRRALLLVLSMLAVAAPAASTPASPQHARTAAPAVLQGAIPLLPAAEAQLQLALTRDNMLGQITSILEKALGSRSPQGSQAGASASAKSLVGRAQGVFASVKSLYVLGQSAPRDTTVDTVVSFYGRLAEQEHMRQFLLVRQAEGTSVSLWCLPGFQGLLGVATDEPDGDEGRPVYVIRVDGFLDLVRLFDAVQGSFNIKDGIAEASFGIGAKAGKTEQTPAAVHPKALSR